jgi:acetolactate synthase-1/2/3 large subunit
MRNDPAYAIVEEADCILAVGFDVVELVRPWKSDAPMIWLSQWQNADPVVPHAVSLVGDMSVPLQQLIDAAYSPEPTWGAARVAEFRRSLIKPLPEPVAGRLLPQQALGMLRNTLPRNTQMAVDVGSHKILSSLEWPTYVPNTFFLSNGLSSMGFALPAAIGAHLAAPDRPTVCLTGDAGMAMIMGELGIIAQRSIPLLLVVFNDGAIDLIRAQQVRAGKPVYGTEFESPNFSQIAAAYGLPTARVTTPEQLRSEVERFTLSSGPLLIEVMLDPISYPTTPRP